MKEAGYDCQAVFTSAAEQVLGIKWLQDELGQVPVFTDKNCLNPGDFLKNADMVLIPVLTLNTAAKVASGIGDNLVTTIIMQALLLGTPVIAAQNACDLNNATRKKLGMNQGNQKYYRLFSNNLKTLREYGINLVEADNLAAAVRGRLKEEIIYRPSAENREMVFNQRVLSAADIALCREPTLRVNNKTLITPAAQDLAERQGISIIVV
ncbi:MAG: flavoprotein [Dehalobacterium sp.]